MARDAEGVSSGVVDPILRRVAALPLPDVEALYAAHRRRLTRLATAVTLDHFLAEEVVQDAFLGLHRHQTSVQNAEAYLQRSVVHGGLKAARRRARAATEVSQFSPVTHIPEVDETWRAVAGLPPRQRAVVVLKFWEDLSEADMARLLGWRRGTVKSTLHRALGRLREELKP